MESIRLFNPTTQLSQRNIAKVTIIPNINTKFDQSQKVSLFKVLPENTAIWIKDYQIVLDKLQQCFEKAEEFSKSLSLVEDEELKEIFRDRAFIRPNQVIEEISDYSIISLAKTKHPFKIDKKIVFATRPPSCFSGLLHIGQKQGNEDCDDRYDDQQFDERETTANSFLMCSTCVRQVRS